MHEQPDGPAMKLIWMTSLCHRTLKPCSLSIVRNTGPAILTLKCGYVLVSDWMGQLFSGIKLKSSCSRFRIAWRCMCQSPTGGSAGADSEIVEAAAARFRVLLWFWFQKVLRLTMRTGIGLQLPNSWSSRWYHSLQPFVRVSSCRRPLIFQLSCGVCVYWCRCPNIWIVG